MGINERDFINQLYMYTTGHTLSFYEFECQRNMLPGSRNPNDQKCEAFLDKEF